MSGDDVTMNLSDLLDKRVSVRGYITGWQISPGETIKVTVEGSIMGIDRLETYKMTVPLDAIEIVEKGPES